jgi:hypothetical protein
MLGKWRDKFANCHLNSRMVLLAFVVLFGSIFLASAYDPTGGAWTSNGGGLKEGYSTSNHESFHYVVGTDGSLWLRYMSKWYGLGGKVTSSPSPLVYRDSAGWEHVFVRGTDGHLWDRRVDRSHITTTEAPGDWIDLGGYIKEETSPAATPIGSLENDVPVLVHGGDDGLWGKVITTTTEPTPNTFIELTTPIQGSWVNLGGKIVGSPYVSFPYTAVRGSDNSLWVNWWNPYDSSPPSWHPLGGVLASDPSIIYDVNSGGARSLIYAKGTEGALWVNKLNQQTMTGAWTCLGGQISGTDSPTSSYSTLDLTSHAFVKGTDNGLWDCVLPGGAWYNLGGQITSKPDTYYYFYNSLGVFVRGGDGALWDYSKTIPI